MHRILFPLGFLSFFFLFAIHGAFPAWAADPVMREPSITVTKVRYKMPEAGEVWLVWGVSDWRPVDPSLRPSGTEVRKGVMHSPMKRVGDIFAVDLRSPSGSALNGGFLITKSANGADLRVWDYAGESAFRQDDDRQAEILTVSQVSVLQDGSIPRSYDRSGRDLLLVLGCVIAPLAALLAWFRIRRHPPYEWSDLSPYARGRRRARRLSYRPVAVVLSVAIGLGMAEYGLRLVEPYGGFGTAAELKWVRQGTYSFVRLFTLDDKLGFRPRMSSDTYNEFGTLHNSYNSEKTAGRTRVLFLGSTYTWEGSLVQALREHYGDSQFEYWNAGVPAFNLEQKIGYYRLHASRSRPDHVVLIVEPGDIESTPIVFRSAGSEVLAYSPNTTWKDINPWLFRYVFLYRLLCGYTLDGGRHRIEEEIRHDLLLLRDTLGQANVRLSVVLLPLIVPQDLWSENETRQQQALAAFLDQEKIKYYNFVEPLTAASKEGIVLQDPPGDVRQPSQELRRRFSDYLVKNNFLGKQ